MKNIITFILILLSFNLFSQKNIGRFTYTSIHKKDYSMERNFIHWIENNDIDSLKKYINNDSLKIDLEQNINSLTSKYPNFRPNYAKPVITDSDSLWFERTYYNEKNKNHCEFQIRLKYKLVNNNLVVSDVLFLDYNSLTNRTEEINKWIKNINTGTNKNNLPPPPPLLKN